LNSLGDLIHIRIPNYIVVETLPESSNPETLFKERDEYTEAEPDLR